MPSYRRATPTRIAYFLCWCGRKSSSPLPSETGRAAPAQQSIDGNLCANRGRGDGPRDSLLGGLMALMGPMGILFLEQLWNCNERRKLVKISLTTSILRTDVLDLSRVLHLECAMTMLVPCETRLYGSSIGYTVRACCHTRLHQMCCRHTHPPQSGCLLLIAACRASQFNPPSWPGGTRGRLGPSLW